MILEADGIQLSFGLNKVLQDIYLKCESSEVVGILGLNGTGKSCLLQIIFGQRRAYSASIRIDSKPFFNIWKHPELIRYLPQNHFIPSNKSLAGLITDFSINEEYFRSIYPNLSSEWNTKLKHLSGGQRRFIECAIILESGSGFIMLDEPFSSLSPLIIDQLKKRIKDLKSKTGIVITDHYYRDILDVADRIYLLKNHKLIEIADRNQLSEMGYLPLPENPKPE